MQRSASQGRTRPEASSSSALWPVDSAAAQRVIWTLWLTYGAFYFCRTNISAAVPGLKGSLAEGGLGLSGAEVGWILASLKIAYGLGQFANGQLAERISPRVLLAAGMFGSAGLNALFGFSSGFYFLLFVWATNGFCQSLGWAPSVRVVANWIGVAGRGRAIGIIGTGYQITLGLTYVVAGQAAQWLSWRGAFYVPAVLLATAGVFMLAALRESPDRQAGSGGDAGRARSSTSNPAAGSLAANLYWTLYNPTLWLLGLTLGLLNACRYGFLDWGVAHLMETQHLPVGKAGLQFFVIAIGATAGSYLAGWATDRYFAGRRAPAVAILMAILGGLTLIYDRVVAAGAGGTMVLLVVIGFCIYGPQVLLVGTAPADLAHRGTAAAAAGFVNFMGYMGAATGDVITGHYSSPEHGGWQVAIYIWAAWAFAGSGIMALLWNTTAARVSVLSHVVPKLAAALLLAAAAGAVAYDSRPGPLVWASGMGAVSALASFSHRWAAWPPLALAGAGLAAVFAAVAAAEGPVTAGQAGALLAYGLALIATLMILVEQKDDRCA